MRIREEQGYLSSDPRLYIMFYRPVHCNGRAILMVHPFAEEKKSAQRIWVDIARTLAENGFYVLMFDLGGCGDSQYGAKYVGISSWLKDIHTAVHYLLASSSANKITMIGLRLGGYLSMLYQKDNPCLIDNLVLIEPVLKPHSYFYQALRSRLIKELLTDNKIGSHRQDLIKRFETEGEIDFSGFLITKAFYGELMEYEKTTDVDALLNHPSITIIHVMWQGGGIMKKKTLQIRHTGCRHRFIELLPFWERIEVEVSYLSITDEILAAIDLESNRICN